MGGLWTSIKTVVATVLGGLWALEHQNCRSHSFGGFVGVRVYKNCKSHSFGRFVGVRVGWHAAETNLRCVRSSGI